MSGIVDFFGFAKMSSGETEENGSNKLTNFTIKPLIDK